jgi:glycosyltransferase involved in cell wall biosynthesis
LAPLRIGSGVKGKLLAALAAGLPVVATPIAAEGIPLVDGVNALLAESPADLAAACLRLDSDDALWRRLSAGGMSVVAEHFSRGLVSRQVRRSFEALFDGATAAGSLTTTR